ncbi:hypothetical protein [Yoonia sp. 208BN28-4]|uniref:hypothetical protein n=1 Tax=Yoonia sp. 208BN28-4 TaxID=3126505 RepID=UPI0030A27CB6
MTLHAVGRTMRRMSIWTNLRRAIRGRPAPERPRALPGGKGRIHFLAGDFRDEAAARAYCYDAIGDLPEALTRDQPEAFIDTDHVEVSFGTHRDRLSEFLDDDTVAGLLDEIDGQNTLIIVAEPAFGGLPYTLQDTEILTYLGPQVVDI